MTNKFNTDFDELLDRWQAQANAVMQNRDKYPLVREKFIQQIFDRESLPSGDLTRLGRNKIDFIDHVIAAAEKHFSKMTAEYRQAEVLNMCEVALEQIPDCGISFGCVVSREVKEPRDVQILIGPQRMVGAINEMNFEPVKTPHEDGLEQRRRGFQERLLGEGKNSVDCNGSEELTDKNDPTGARRLQAQLDEMRARDRKDSKIDEAKPIEAKSVKDDGVQSDSHLRFIMLNERSRRL